MLYLINYDLRISGRDYSPLYNAIANLGPALNCLQSSWLLQSASPITSIRSSLQQYLTESDSLLVVDITGKSYDGWLNRNYWSWLREHNF